MIDIAAIESVLDKKALVYTEEHGGYFQLILKETGSEAKLKRLSIGGVSNDSVLIKTDGAEPLNALLSKDFGQRCRCDYIMLTERGGRNVLVFCELKSSSFSCSEVTNQFKGGKCLVRYLESLLLEFHNKREVLPPETEWYYVLFYKDSVRKRTTKRPKVKIGRSEKKFCKYPNPGLVDFKELVG